VDNVRTIFRENQFTASEIERTHTNTHLVSLLLPFNEEKYITNVHIRLIC